MTTSTMDCPEARISLGVYVLGAIDPAERAQVDAHLATCRECRDELAGLASLPALLARVSKEEAIALAAPEGAELPAEDGPSEPPRELLATVLDLTAARHRRRRWRDASLAVGAAAIVGVGVFGGLQLKSGSAPAASQIQSLSPGPQNGQMATMTGRSGSMAATVGYASMGWGTQLDAKVSGIPMGTNCELWVVDTAGKRILVGNWMTDNLEGSVWYPASTALGKQDISSFEITVGQGQAISVGA